MPPSSKWAFWVFVQPPKTSSMVNNGALPDYLPPHTIVVLDEPHLIESAVSELDAQASELRYAQIERGDLPKNFPVPYFTWPELTTRLNRFEQRLSLNQWSDESQSYVMNFAPAPNYNGRLPVLFQSAAALRQVFQGALGVAAVGLGQAQ